MDKNIHINIGLKVRFELKWSKLWPISYPVFYLSCDWLLMGGGGRWGHMTDRKEENHRVGRGEREWHRTNHTSHLWEKESERRNKGFVIRWQYNTLARWHKCWWAESRQVARWQVDWYREWLLVSPVGVVGTCLSPGLVACLGGGDSGWRSFPLSPRSSPGGMTTTSDISSGSSWGE